LQGAAHLLRTRRAAPARTGRTRRRRRHVPMLRCGMVAAMARDVARQTL